MEIGAAYYINLDERSDRRRHMEAQAPRLPGVPLRRWPAVRPTDRTLETTWASYTRRGLAPYLGRYRRRWRKRERYYGVIGCYLSHVRMLEHLAMHHAGEDGSVLVLEDDVVLADGFLETLRERLRTPAVFELDWDFIRVDCWGDRVDELRVAPEVYRLDRPWQTDSSFGGSHVVVWRPAKAPRLLEILATRPIRDFDGLWSRDRLFDLVTQLVVYTGRSSIRRSVSDIRPRGVNRVRWKLRRSLASLARADAPPEHPRPPSDVARS